MLKSNYKPIGINVLVSKILPETKTSGGIILPERAVQDDGLYVVVAMGSGQRASGEPFVPEYVVGDTVLLPNYLGTPLPEDNNYKIITMDTPLCIVSKAN